MTKRGVNLPLPEELWVAPEAQDQLRPGAPLGRAHSRNGRPRTFLAASLARKP